MLNARSTAELMTIFISPEMVASKKKQN